MVFDSHAHYDDEQFDEDREELLSNLSKNGVEYIVNVGAGIESTKKTIELSERYHNVYGAVGVHPTDAAELDNEKLEWLKSLSRHKKVVAIGEIGLDYYWDEPDRKIQKKWFLRQMELAKEMKLPMIIHSRDAAKDTLDMMIAADAKQVGGVVHCFSYSVEMAKEYLSLGFYIGVGGVITFNNAKKLKEVVEYVPLECILLETDCPYLAPVPNRGKRNSSLNLPYVAKEIATIKGIEYEKVVEVTALNAKKLYRING